MTPAQFWDAVGRTKLPKRSVEMARWAMLNGVPQKDVAHAFAVNPSRVAQIVGKVRRAHERGDMVPVTVSVPAARVGELRRLARSLR